jgi:hypothetical protein
MDDGRNNTVVIRWVVRISAQRGARGVYRTSLSPSSSTSISLSCGNRAYFDQHLRMYPRSCEDNAPIVRPHIQQQRRDV